MLVEMLTQWATAHFNVGPKQVVEVHDELAAHMIEKKYCVPFKATAKRPEPEKPVQVTEDKVPAPESEDDEDKE